MFKLEKQIYLATCDNMICLWRRPRGRQINARCSNEPSAVRSGRQPVCTHFNIVTLVLPLFFLTDEDGFLCVCRWLRLRLSPKQTTWRRSGIDKFLLWSPPMHWPHWWRLFWFGSNALDSDATMRRICAHAKWPLHYPPPDTQYAIISPISFVIASSTINYVSSCRLRSARRMQRVVYARVVVCSAARIEVVHKIQCVFN